jgi:hypothetical protein
MAVDEAAVRAAGEAAATVAGGERAANGRREGPSLPADVEGRPGGVIEDRDDAGIAEEAPGRFRGDPGLVAAASEGGGVDVDHDLDRGSVDMVAAKGGLGHREEALEARLRGDLERLEEAGGLFGAELDADPDHAVVGVTDTQPALRLLAPRGPRLGLGEEAADLLELRGGAVARDLDQAVLVSAVATRVMARTFE